MRILAPVAALAIVLVPSAASGQNPVSPGPRSAPCWQVPASQSSRCIQDALSLVRWRLDEYIAQRDRERTGMAIVDQAHRSRMDTLRGIQQHWQAYVEGHCRQVSYGMNSEAFSETTCLVDAYDRRLADLLPMLCERAVATCAETEAFEARHRSR